MINRNVIAALAILLFLLEAAGAAETAVPKGGTVFIGEEGLDVHLTGAPAGTEISWFGPRGNPSSGAPQSSVTVDDPQSFYVSPASFSGRTGPWFLPDKTTAFYVEEPQLTLRVRDETLDFDIVGTTRWVPKGDVIGFRIETNLAAISRRPGSAGAPVSIHVRSPDGAEYSQVSGFPLKNIPVTTSPYSTGGVWATGESDYKGGTYVVWAECNANGMKDNYPQEGKTVTPPVNVLIQLVNPLITRATTPVPVTSQVPSTISTIPPTSIQTAASTPPNQPPATGTLPPTPENTEIPVSQTTERQTPPPTTAGAGIGFAVLSGLTLTVIAARMKRT